MAYSEEIKQGLRHNKAEPENYIWLSNGSILIKVPSSDVDPSFTIEQKFLTAKALAESGNLDIYITDISQ